MTVSYEEYYFYLRQSSYHEKLKQVKRRLWLQVTAAEDLTKTDNYAEKSKQTN